MTASRPGFHLPWLPWRVRVVRDVLMVAAAISLLVVVVVHSLVGWEVWVVAASVGLSLFAYLLYIDL
jgi:hypothetical protein